MTAPCHLRARADLGPQGEHVANALRAHPVYLPAQRIAHRAEQVTCFDPVTQMHGGLEVPGRR